MNTDVNENEITDVNEYEEMKRETKRNETKSVRV